MITTQKALIDAMEPLATNTPIDTLTDAGGQEALSAASAAISLKRIADILTVWSISLHREGELTTEELERVGIKP